MWKGQKGIQVKHILGNCKGISRKLTGERLQCFRTFHQCSSRQKTERPHMSYRMTASGAQVCITVLFQSILFVLELYRCFEYLLGVLQFSRHIGCFGGELGGLGSFRAVSVLSRCFPESLYKHTVWVLVCLSY